MVKRIILTIAVAVFAYSAKAEGYAVNLQGNKQSGMGHVGTALNFDASSMQWNPGTLTTLDKKFSFSLGGSAIFTNTEFTGTLGKEETDNSVGTPFYFYGSTKVTDKLAFGLGIYTPFGNKVDWGKNWSGRYLIQDIGLKDIHIQPTVAYQVTKCVSIGAGLTVVYEDVELNKAINLTGLGGPVDGSAKITGNKIEYGYNLGIFIRPTEKLNVGVSYRSKVEMELGYADADVDFTVVAPVSSLFPDGRVAVTLPLPSSLNLGVAYQINPKWLVSADVNFVQWGEYESLDFDFETNTTTTIPTPSGPVVYPVLSDSNNARDWDNSATYRIGAQYSANEKLDIRAGFYYDETPTNKIYYSPETPGANKIGVSAGLSYKLNDKLSLDASLLYINGEKTTAYDTNPTTQTIYGAAGFGGEYKNKGWIPGIGISYNF